ncbi:MULTISPECIES: hypothetical protein [Photorhabdus]|uniref:Uncharacterized protein n=1 Tax=Photorhabdus thracensis TaxID=230089 RepID=A0A0F7LJN5_9GAMM|nr:hypothetical protein [Photorhabdus thracensis]AKH62017.1 hypothetical protein VY86_00200 [Photorhabdus thracensis]
MKSTIIFPYLLFFLTLSTIASLFIITLLIRFVVGMIAYYQFGEIDFSLNDVIYAVKVGIAGGIPLGIGASILANLKESKEKFPPSDS